MPDVPHSVVDAEGRINACGAGAGVTGLYAAGVLRQNGITFCILDKRDTAGGIWSRLIDLLVP